MYVVTRFLILFRFYNFTPLFAGKLEVSQLHGPGKVTPFPLHHSLVCVCYSIPNLSNNCFPIWELKNRFWNFLWACVDSFHPHGQIIKVTIMKTHLNPQRLNITYFLVSVMLFDNQRNGFWCNRFPDFYSDFSWLVFPKNICCCILKSLLY